MSDQTNQQQPVQTEPSLSELLQIRRDKLTELQKAGKDPFAITRYDVTHHSSEVKENFEQMEGQTVRLAGRLMSKRGMGKAVFSDLQDGAGRIQLYVRIDDVGEEALAAFKKYDIGDIVGVEGEVFRTKRGEISIKAKTITLLSKFSLPRRDAAAGSFGAVIQCFSCFEKTFVSVVLYPRFLFCIPAGQPRRGFFATFH